MARKVQEGLVLPLVRITDKDFDDIIGGYTCEVKYFTKESNNIIYEALTNLGATYLPYLGPHVEFGLGDLVLEEGKDGYKVYFIDRASIFQLNEFDNIVDAIENLIDKYVSYDELDRDMIAKIFYDTLKLERAKTRGTNVRANK